MTASILVATPHPAFGELLRISLEESEQYQVILVLTAKEARAAASQGVFQLAILDSDLRDEPFVPLCYDLLSHETGLRLLVVPPENNPNHPSLGGLMPHGYLSRPFYLPDLMQTLARLLNERSSRPQSDILAPAPLSLTIPAWLQEPLTLNAYLTKELSGTQALGAVVGQVNPQPGSGRLRASAGTLSEEAAEELAKIVFRYWKRDDKIDLMRFVRLAADKHDYLVYATQITGDLVLSMVYDNGAALSQIRPQTKSVAQTLASLPPEGFGIGWNPQTAQPGLHATLAENLVAEQAAPAQPTHVSSSHDPITQPLQNAHPRHSNNENVDEDEDVSELEKLINLSRLLGSVPSPDPENGPGNGNNPDDGKDPINPIAGGWIPEDLEESPNENNLVVEARNSGLLLADEAPKPSPEERRNTQVFALLKEEDASQETETKVDPVSPTRPIRVIQQTIPQPAPSPLPVDYSLPTEPQELTGRDAPETEIEKPVPGLVEQRFPPETPAAIDGSDQKAEADPAAVEDSPEIHETQQELGQSFQNTADTSVEPFGDPLEETRPRIITTLTHLSQLEPVSPALSLLNYTCVLVPRLPNHYLASDLADNLAQWVAQLCLAFGWRLEGISIRPEYLQWSVQVAPAVSPGNMVRIVRQRTSTYIFSNFAHLTEQNPSGDFWATGYLIVAGPQPPSAQLLRDYIAQTRRRQGI